MKKSTKIILIAVLVVALTAVVFMSQRLGISSKLFQGSFFNLFRIEKTVDIPSATDSVEKEVQIDGGDIMIGPGDGR